MGRHGSETMRDLESRPEAAGGGEQMPLAGEKQQLHSFGRHRLLAGGRCAGLRDRDAMAEAEMPLPSGFRARGRAKGQRSGVQRGRA